MTERRSLLLVIAALLVLAGFSKERGASTRILQQLQRMGVQLSDDTVRRILKAVSEGLKDWKSG